MQSLFGARISTLHAYTPLVTCLLFMPIFCRSFVLAPRLVTRCLLGFLRPLSLRWSCAFLCWLFTLRFYGFLLYALLRWLFFAFVARYLCAFVADPFTCALCASSFTSLINLPAFPGYRLHGLLPYALLRW